MVTVVVTLIMKMQEQVAELEALLRKLEQTQQSTAQDIAEGLQLGERLRDEARAVGDASSGSWVGWHSRMYYGDYEEPPVADSWNSEWGSIHGYSDLWRQRTLPEVQQRIEAGAGTSLAAVASLADRVRETCEPLHREVLTVLSPICDLAGLDKESQLLVKIEEIKWILPASGFINAMAPKQVMSRDSAAMSQGMHPPLHLNVEAAIVSNTSTLGTARGFLHDTARLIRQIRTKLRAAPLAHPERTGSTPAADPILARQVRRQSIMLFVLLAAVIGAAAIIAFLRFVENPVWAAAIVVAAALLIGGIYALLIERKHAKAALGSAALVLGAVAAIEQLLDR